VTKLTTVVNCKTTPYDVLIDRTTKFGNPWVVGKHGTREEVIALHRQWVLRRPELVAAIKRELRGKVLGCHCKPKACHGDTLAAIANGELG